MNDGFHGFDVGQLTTFAGTLGALSSHATGLHTKLTTLLSDVARDLPPGHRVSNNPDLQKLVTFQPLFPLPRMPAPGNGSTTALPGMLTPELSGMQAEIKRRITQLKGCKAFEKAGFPVDDASVFLDEGAPDGKKVDAALKALQALQHTDFGVNGDTDDLKKVGTTLAGLTSAELDAVFSKATPADLAHYNKLMNDHGDSGWNPFDSNGLSPEERDKTLGTLLSRIGPENFDKFVKAFPSVQPIFTNTDAYKRGENPQNKADGRGVHYEIPATPLFDGPVTLGQVHQVGLGDCWYFATLVSLAQRDPTFLQNGIKQNPNGTVSVRIWDKEGDFRWVTVTPDILMNGDGSTVSATGVTCTWPAYYEKAFAAVYGGQDGYGGIEGDIADHAVPYVSGSTAHDIKSGGFLGIGKHDNLDIPNLKELYESGKGVTIATRDVDDGTPGLPQGFVGDHVFSVSGFTPDGKIVLSNPWDPGHLKVTVDQKQLNTYFEQPEWFTIP